MYKLFLFDFDGTLLDSDHMIVVTFQELYAKYKPDYNATIEHMLSFSGPPIRETLLNEFPNENQNVMFNEFVKYSTINYDKYVNCGDEKRNLITEFNSNNTKLLSVEETKAKIMSLAYIQEELKNNCK